MSRITDPICDHKRRGIVKAGHAEGAYAATNVCDRPKCIEDAKFWARAITGMEPQHIPDGVS